MYVGRVAIIFKVHTATTTLEQFDGPGFRPDKRHCRDLLYAVM